jgi:hypothetical protein
VNEEELIRETRELIRRWDNVRVVGLGWSGDPRRGFQFNPTDVRTGGGGSTTPIPPTTPSGACCPTEGDCFIATQSICETGGGTYQGDNTTCDPDPCPPKGACCVGSNCTIETETDCTDMGGTYQGDDTVCDPNPCVLPPCNGCGFDAFDGSGRKFFTKTYTVSYSSNYTVSTTGETCSITVNYSRVSSYDPDTCVLSVNCSGFYTSDYHPPVGPDVHHEGDPCLGVSGDCGLCPGGCPTYFPSEAEPTCGSIGCSCSATELMCSISHMQDPSCGPNLTGSCSTEVTSILSDECTP